MSISFHQLQRVATLAALFLTITTSARAQVHYLPSDSVLRRWAAQMLMVGFRGNTIDDQSDAARYVRDLHVGSIVLFDVDLTGDASIGSRNVTSKEQVAQLTRDLQGYAHDYRLLIALDQEGGKVARLKPQYGFEPVVSQEYLGKLGNEDSTRFYGHRIASQLSSSGVNVNLAPVIDINHPDCPAIGRLQRSYGDVRTVVKHSKVVIDEHHKQHVLCAVKHFPGHGSATSDSHWGFVDVTLTWSPQELEPFKKLIKKRKIDLVMTAHIFNRNIDPHYPATLSRKTIDGLLRKQLGYDGVVVTDDMYMEGIIKQYNIENALILAINAGADLLCVGNNINTGFEADRPFRLVDIIVKAVKQGRIPYGRLYQSHQRIEKLLKKLK